MFTFQKKQSKYNALFAKKKEQEEKEFFWFGHPAIEQTRTQLRLARSHERNEYDFPAGETSTKDAQTPKPQNPIGRYIEMWSEMLISMRI